MKITTSIYLEVKRKNKEGKHAVKLQICFNRVQKYYSIKSLLKDNDWNALDRNQFNKVMSREICSGKMPRGVNKDIKYNYDSILQEARTIIDSIPVFSFQKFDDLYNGVTTKWSYVAEAFVEVINELQKEERFGYATSICSTLTAIKYFMERQNYPPRSRAGNHSTFNKYKKLIFVDVDVRWLKAFRIFLTDNRKSVSTIGIHERNIRMIFNKALQKGVKADYPFRQFKCSSSTNKKRPLSIEQIKAIASYSHAPSSNEGYYRDLFMFSLFCNGANVSDVLRLKYQNISGAEIIFERRKTKNKSEKTTIVSRLTEPLQKIIKEHSKFSINEDDFIFPELNNSMNEKQRYARIQSTTKLINKHLKRIADNLGFDNDLARCISTYYARHSYATLLKNDNVSVAEISESLGHSSIQTTQNYLSSIDVAQRTRTANQLVNLLK